MDFEPINKASILCKRCNTEMFIPIDAETYHYAKQNEFQFACPTCKNDLSDIMKSARERTIQYNLICKDIQSLIESGCMFLQ